ncbi:MAG: C25 family cysteine peptidase [bacterium]
MRDNRFEFFILYNREMLEQIFGSDSIARIQDAFVSSLGNCLFIEYSETRRADLKEYILSTASNSTMLIIAGDHNMVPFESIESPVSDGDRMILTDNFFAGKLLEIPDIPVSRIPFAESEGIDDYIRKLDRILSNVELSCTEKFGMTAAVWQTSAARVFDSIDGMGEMIVSPPFSIEDNEGIAFNNVNGCLYFNVHGAEHLPGWYGQKKPSDNESEEFPLCITPGSFTEGLNTSFIMTEACFGGFVKGKKAQQSIALTALSSGISFFLGSTATAYGTYFPPLSEADMLCSIFADELRSGNPAGIALRDAKQKFARRNIEKHGFLDNDDKKTLLTFTLYGNPSAEVIDETE